MTSFSLVFTEFGVITRYYNSIVNENVKTVTDSILRVDRSYNC